MNMNGKWIFVLKREFYYALISPSHYAWNYDNDNDGSEESIFPRNYTLIWKP